MFKPMTLSGMMLAPVLLAGCVTSTGNGATSSGQIDPDTGISRDALVRVGAMADGDTTLYGIFYQQDRIDRAQLKAAPARLCAAKKQTLVSGEDKALEHPDQLPGLRKLLVRCK
ncbi:hypothetical protein [Paracoccus lutimaris]|uniref:Lipoprotein n=1 Tax=Paracoccus lutimaris TaxID=1490030 RepID=A0A368YKP7_9RHOB|nr:hypothetical protein [Paracoccus lutimaris]RCW80811.1 hypothetical protein DFP89_11757 [Paracoccus lutimaris]